MSNIGENKVADRQVLKEMLGTYGKRGLLLLIAERLGASTRQQRGRSTLEERPFHFARRTCLEVVKSLEDQERAVEVPAWKSGDVRTVDKMLTHYGPVNTVPSETNGPVTSEKDGGIMSVLRGLFIGNAKAQKAFDVGAKNMDEAIAHLFTRRQLFKGSDAAQKLGFNRDRIRAAG